MANRISAVEPPHPHLVYPPKNGAVGIGAIGIGAGTGAAGTVLGVVNSCMRSSPWSHFAASALMGISILSFICGLHKNEHGNNTRPGLISSAPVNPPVNSPIVERSISETPALI